MSGRPIARLNATDVNVFFDNNSTTKATGAVYGNVRDTDQGCFDVHEHDVLLQGAHQPHGMRQMAVFSSLRYKQKDTADAARIKHFIENYKFAGLAVTPYTPRLGSEGFQQGQGFVATFTGLNVGRVAEDVICGDILVAVPPLSSQDKYLRDIIGVFFVIPMCNH